MLPKFGDRAFWSLFAITAPQNLARAELCAREEIARILKDGVTEKELQEAKKGLLQSRAVNRAQDDYLAQGWLGFLAMGKTFAYSKAFDDAVEKLTVADVKAALKRMIDETSITWVLAGDAAKAKAEGKAF